MNSKVQFDSIGGKISAELGIIPNIIPSYPGRTRLLLSKSEQVKKCLKRYDWLLPHQIYFHILLFTTLSLTKFRSTIVK